MIIGFHVKKNHRTMASAINEDIELVRGFGFKNICAQIFVAGPQNTKPTLTHDDIDELTKQSKSGIMIIIHGTYLDNPWSRRGLAIHNIKDELIVAHKIGTHGLVIHLDSHAYNPENLKYAIEAITNPRDDAHDIYANYKTQFPALEHHPHPIIYLETHAAKQSMTTYETVDKIQALFNKLQGVDTHGYTIGLCIDTAHLFSCGFAMDTYEVANKWLTDLYARVNCPIMFHLNDSASTLGSGKDVHAVLTHGNIWKHYRPGAELDISTSGLDAILLHAEIHSSPVILERDYEGAIKDLVLIQSMGFGQ